MVQLHRMNPKDRRSVDMSEQARKQRAVRRRGWTYHRTNSFEEHQQDYFDSFAKVSKAEKLRMMFEMCGGVAPNRSEWPWMKLSLNALGS